MPKIHTKAPWRQAQVCLRPLSSYGEDRASRPPPLQHRVPHTSRGRTRLLEGFRRRRFASDCSGTNLFSHRLSRFRNRRGRLDFMRLQFGLTASWTYVWASLRGSIRCRSAAANSGLLATPVSFRLTQSPLGADLLPQAPTSVVSSRHRERLSLTRAWWEFPRLSPIPVPSLSSSRNPEL